MPNQEKLTGGAGPVKLWTHGRAHRLAGLPFVQVVLLLLFLLPAVVILRGCMISPAVAFAGPPPQTLHLEAPQPPHQVWWLVCVFEKNSSSKKMSNEHIKICRALPVTVEAFREGTKAPTPKMNLVTFRAQTATWRHCLCGTNRQDRKVRTLHARFHKGAHLVIIRPRRCAAAGGAGGCTRGGSFAIGVMHRSRLQCLKVRKILVLLTAGHTEVLRGIQCPVSSHTRITSRQ